MGDGGWTHSRSVGPPTASPEWAWPLCRQRLGPSATSLGHLCRPGVDFLGCRQDRAPSSSPASATMSPGCVTPVSVGPISNLTV